MLSKENAATEMNFDTSFGSQFRPIQPGFKPFSSSDSVSENEVDQFYSYVSTNLNEISNLPNFPARRIRHILKQQLRGNFGEDAIIALAHACKIFVLEFSIRARLERDRHNRKTSIKIDDFQQACCEVGKYDFLVDVFDGYDFEFSHERELNESNSTGLLQPRSEIAPLPFAPDTLSSSHDQDYEFDAENLLLHLDHFADMFHPLPPPPHLVSAQHEEQPLLSSTPAEIGPEPTQIDDTFDDITEIPLPQLPEIFPHLHSAVNESRSGQLSLEEARSFSL